MPPFNPFAPAPIIRLVGPDANTPGSLKVVNNNAVAINAWLNLQRNAVGSSTIDIHKSFFSSPECDVTYRSEYGAEIVEIRPYVTPTEVETREEAFTTPTFEIPEQVVQQPESLPPLCLMVLFKNKQVAAFDMTTITAPVIAPIYQSTITNGSYTQPVITGQFKFASQGFIQTDVDLSGRGLDPSIICTTLLIDAKSLGSKVLPILNSPQTAGQDAGDVTLYTSAGEWLYLAGHFLQQSTPPWLGTQPVSMSTTGTATFAPSFTGSNALGAMSLSVNVTGLDDSLVAPAVLLEQQKVYTYTYVYQLGFVEVLDYKEQYDATLQLNPVIFPINAGLMEVTWAGDYEMQDTTQTNVTLYIAATVIAEDTTGLPPGHDNQIVVTEFLGTSYFGQATMTTAITIEGIKLAYDLTPYFGFDPNMNEYHIITPIGQVNANYGNDLTLMNWAGGAIGTISLPVDAQQPAAVNTITLVSQIGIIAGGNLYGGMTVVGEGARGGGYIGPDLTDPDAHLEGGRDGPGFPILSPPPGETNPDLSIPNGTGQYLISSHITTQQVSTHSTFDPRNPSENDGSYAGGLAITADVIAVMEDATLGPPIIHTFTASGGTVSTASYVNAPAATGPSIGGFNRPEDHITTSQSATSSGDTLQYPVPQELNENITSVYTSSITFQGQTVPGTDAFDANGNVTSGTFLVEFWPPCYQGKPYYTMIALQQAAFEPQTFNASIVTPYDTQSEGPKFGSISLGALKGWLHVANDKHCIQGYFRGAVPYLWLDGKDFMTPLTKALDCLPTDIAALYMDIQLDTIKNLVNVS